MNLTDTYDRLASASETAVRALFDRWEAGELTLDRSYVQ